MVPDWKFCRQRFFFFLRKADDKADSDLTLDQVATDLTPAAQCLSFFFGCWFWERWRFLQENRQFGEINHDLPCFATIWFLAPNVSRIFLKTTFYNYKTDSANGSPNCWSKIAAWNLWFQSGALMTTAFRVLLIRNDFISLMILKPVLVSPQQKLSISFKKKSKKCFNKKSKQKSSHPGKVVYQLQSFKMFFVKHPWLVWISMDLHSYSS